MRDNFSLRYTILYYEYDRGKALSSITVYNPVLWIQNYLFRIRLQLFWVQDQNPIIFFHYINNQKEETTKLYHY